MLDDEILRQIREGLEGRPRTLPFALLYDGLGSALFDAITHLPEYGLTRADERLLARHAPDVIEALPGPIEIAEMGPGTGAKAAVVLAAALEAQSSARFFAIDVSPAALDAC